MEIWFHFSFQHNNFLFFYLNNAELVREAFQEAFETIKRLQYKAWCKANEEDKKTIEIDPFLITRKAVKNCTPLLKLCPVTRGFSYFRCDLFVNFDSIF